MLRPNHGPIKSHRDLRVWQEAMDLVVEMYRITKSYPRDEIYGLVAQTRRAAISIAANIAEGRGRLTTREFLRFLGIANGSLCELQCHLDLGRRLGYLTETDLVATGDLADRVGRMLTTLRAALGRRMRGPSQPSP
jgi:four helix bundle protein